MFEWFLTVLLPVFGITEDMLAISFPIPFTALSVTVSDLICVGFVGLISVVSLHLLIVVPYNVILRLTHYKRAKR